MQGKRLVISGTTELHERVSPICLVVQQYADQQIAKLEAALASTHSQLSTGTHPLLGPEHLDGGSSSISPPHRAPALSHSDSSPDTHPSSLRVVTPVTSITEHGSHPRMAVESLLLSDDIASEGRKDAEWVGENAAPAFIVCPLLHWIRLRLTIRLVQPCQQNQKQERKSFTSYWIYIVSSHLGKRLSVEPNDTSQAASGCESCFVHWRHADMQHQHHSPNRI